MFHGTKASRRQAFLGGSGSFPEVVLSSGVQGVIFCWSGLRNAWLSRNVKGPVISALTACSPVCTCAFAAMWFRPACSGLLDRHQPCYKLWVSATRRIPFSSRRKRFYIINGGCARPQPNTCSNIARHAPPLARGAGRMSVGRDWVLQLGREWCAAKP